MDNEPDEFRWVKTDLPLNYFISVCDLVPEDEMMNIIFQIAQMEGKLNR